jgi:hypothetical protein
MRKLCFNPISFEEIRKNSPVACSTLCEKIHHQGFAIIQVTQETEIIFETLERTTANFFRNASLGRFSPIVPVPSSSSFLFLLLFLLLLTLLLLLVGERGDLCCESISDNKDLRDRLELRWNTSNEVGEKEKEKAQQEKGNEKNKGGVVPCLRRAQYTNGFDVQAVTGSQLLEKVRMRKRKEKKKNLLTILSILDLLS